MEQCPNCRARYKGENECSRCGIDLSALLTIESQIENGHRTAIQRIAKRDFKGAEQVLRRVLDLRTDPLAQSLLGYVRIMTFVRRQS